MCLFLFLTCYPRPFFGISCTSRVPLPLVDPSIDIAVPFSFRLPSMLFSPSDEAIPRTVFH